MKEFKQFEDKLLKVEHVWIESSDRWIYIEYYKSGYLGLNFAQGDDYENFKEGWCTMDRALSEFYSESRETIVQLAPGTLPEIEIIDKMLWLYHSAVWSYQWFDNRVQHEYNKKN